MKFKLEVWFFFRLPLPALENFDVVVGTDTYTENPDTDKVYKIERIIFSSNDKLQLKIEMKGRILKQIKQDFSQSKDSIHN